MTFTDPTKIVLQTIIEGAPEVVSVKDPAYGAAGNGTTDDTAPIQAALNDTPAGGVCFVPTVARGLFYKFSTLVVPDGVNFLGSGWDWRRDALAEMGSAGWADRTNYGGSVLVSTAAGGSAIAVSPSETRRGGLGNMLVVGPGSGAAVGAALGSPTHALVDAAFPNLGIGNFPTGMTRDFVEDCVFTGTKIHGCAEGLSDGNNTNNNLHELLSISRCGDGQSHRDVTCLGNLYLASLFQGNTGLPLSVDGRNNVWETPYLENDAATNSITFAAGAINCHVRDLEVDGALANSIIHTFTAGSSYCSLEGFRIPLTIVNNGSQCAFEGNLANYSGAGPNAYKIDPYNNRMSIPMALDTDLVMVAASNKVIQFASCTTATRPPAAGARGGTIYDATLGYNITRDGLGNWRNGAGAIV